MEKMCRTCHKTKPLDDFHLHNKSADGHLYSCKACHIRVGVEKKRQLRLDQPFLYFAWRAKGRARKMGLDFDLTPEFLESIWSEVCPVLGTPFAEPVHSNRDGYPDNYPTLDRIIPSKGYTQGNVAFISFRANRLKQNSSIDDLRRLVGWLEQQGESDL